MKEVNYRDVAPIVLEKLAEGGVFLTVKDRKGRVNTMNIGWGSVAHYWNMPVFVAPVRDERSGAMLPPHEGGCPIRYGTDEVWERPVVQMLSEVLQRQLADSELFPQVVEHADPAALVVVPTVSPCATSRAVAVRSPERCICQVIWSSTQPEYIA